VAGATSTEVFYLKSVLRYFGSAHDSYIISKTSVQTNLVTELIAAAHPPFHSHSLYFTPRHSPKVLFPNATANVERVTSTRGRSVRKTISAFSSIVLHTIVGHVTHEITRAGLKGEGTGDSSPRSPTNRGPPTKPFI